ncbi:MAG: ABC transporter substrate-binding protein [Alloprevotella sp.]
MTLSKTTLCLAWAFLFCLLACQKQDAPTVPMNFGNERYDSTALHLALMPNRDCLPLYYAQRTGLFDSLGLKVQIASYHSQMDCDTALRSRTADGGWADNERLMHWGKPAEPWHTLLKDTGRWQLLVNSKQRIKQVKDLNGRTLAISRQSASTAVLAEALQTGSLRPEQVYRPQINDLKLRASMLAAGQVDGAVLPWPYTAMATAQGCRTLYTSQGDGERGCLVVKASLAQSDTGKRQLELLEKGRKMALDSIAKKGAAAYSLILQNDYGLPKEVADTVKF